MFNPFGKQVRQRRELAERSPGFGGPLETRCWVSECHLSGFVNKSQALAEGVRAAALGSCRPCPHGVWMCGCVNGVLIAVRVVKTPSGMF